MLRKLKEWSKEKVKPKVPNFLWGLFLWGYRLPRESRRRLWRMYLQPFAYFCAREKQEDITVVISVKNRYDTRITNALKSIRNQDYNQDLINITVVDYDSQKGLIPKYKKVCDKFNAEYLRVDNKPIWCKSHALNIAIKRAKTKYILSTDVDNIFEKTYIKEAIKELRRNAFQVILSEIRDLPKHSIKTEDFDELKSLAKLRYKRDNPGTNLTLTCFYHKIHGYDEVYKLWGKEDCDLVKRFYLMGLNIKSIRDNSYFLHQWHPKFEGILNQNYLEQLMKNNEYFIKHNSIVRNKDGWGIYS